MALWLMLVAAALTAGEQRTAPAADAEATRQRAADRLAGARYADAAIGLSRLHDVLDQAERLAVYAREAEALRPERASELTDVREDVSQSDRALEVEDPLPGFRAFDYAAISRRLDDNLGRATRLRDALRTALAADAPWFHPLPLVAPGPVMASTDKQQLLNRFLIFPLVISEKDDDYYGGDGNWELLQRFGFEAVCPWAGAHIWIDGEGVSGMPLDTILADAFARLDILIATNARHGMKTSVWIEPDRVVRALEQESGNDIYLHDSEGRFYRRSRIHNSANIWHPRVVEQLKTFVTRLGERYRDNPDVLCYEVFEEPALVLSDPSPAPGSTISLTATGYGEAATRAYRAYLAGQYPSIEALNARWGTGYASFEAVAPPAKLDGPGINPAEVYDFGRFRTSSHAAFFARLVGALQEADPVHAVVPQFLPMFCSWRYSGLDAFALAGAGWDFYATHDWPGQGPAWETAYTWSVALWANKPLWNEEYIWSNWVRRDQGEAALWAGARSGVWRQFAWGKRCLELFEWDVAWESEFEGDWNNALLNRRAGKLIPRYAAGVFPVMAQKMDRLAQYVYPTRVVNDGLGQLVPTASLLAA